MIRRILATAGREIRMEAASPAAWAFLVIFLVLSSLCAFVAGGMFSSGQADLSPFFDWMPWLFLLIVPALAMPIWSEERRTGVFELSLSFPASLTELVIGKYLAGGILLAFALLLTLPVPVTALVLGEPDPGAILCGYAGAWLLGMVYLAISGFCSALTKSQTASFLLSLAICGAFLFAGWPKLMEMAEEWLPREVTALIASCAFLPNYQSFQKGIADTSELVYAVSLSGLFLALTSAVLTFAAAGTGSFFAPGGMKEKAFRKALLGAAGRALSALLIAVSLCLAANCWRLRIDVSSDRAYSISRKAAETVRALPEGAVLRLYASHSDPSMNAPLRKYAKRVEWLLKEFVSASRGKVTLEVVDPQPDSPEEESAILEGLAPLTDASGNRVYLGVSASCEERTVSVPVLSPKEENLLEYEIARILLSAVRKDRPKLGILSPLPVLGETPDLSRVRRSPEGGAVSSRPPWFALSELKKNFELIPLAMDAEIIPEEIGVLLVIHPSGIPERTLFALDRFVGRGGKMAVFLDPRSYYAVLKSRTDYTFVNLLDSDLGPLTGAWGVRWNRNLMAADMVTAYRKKLPGRILTVPMVLNLTKEQISRKDPAVSGLNSLQLYFPGFFSLSERPGVRSEILFSTSPECQVVSALLGDRTELVIRNFRSQHSPLALAVKLTGILPSAYPDGPPGHGKSSGYRKDPPKRVPSEVWLFADSDMLFNDVCVRAEQGISGKKSYLPANDNIALLQNVMEHLAGWEDLSSLRGRIPMSRPLTKVSEMKAKAELRYRDRILAIERDFARSAARMKVLRQKAGGKITPAEKRESDQLARTMAAGRRELAILRNRLRSDLERLENRIRIINIVIIPLLTVLAGGIWAFLRRKPAGERRKVG